MLHRQLSKGAPCKGAPFVFGLTQCTGILLGCLVQPVQAVNCEAEQIDERVQVAHVFDGDTVKLEDGRRLRLIGINTPENGRNGQPSQAYAAQATKALRELLENSHNTLQLQHGTQQHDHYGRMLAHGFLGDGRNLAAQMLDQGLATTLVVPPNTWGLTCYQRLEWSARADGRGLWSLPQYQAHASASLHSDTRGFRIIRGKVNAVRQSRYSVWLAMDGPLTVHIARKDLTHFETDFLPSITGKTIEIRGWVKTDKRGLRLNLRHPAALNVLVDVSA